MGIFELTPSIRADTEAFNKALKELGWSKDQYHRKIKRLGISLSDKTSTKNFLNDALKKIGSTFRYKNIMQAPIKIATETRMGGVTPGRVGAPANEKIWRDGAKIQKVAEKKFKNLTDQRKFFVETMKKLYKNVPKKEILHIFKNILRGVKSFSPIGIMSELAMDVIEKNPKMMDILPTNQQKEMIFKGGGMADIDYMTRPLGYSHGGISDIEMQKRSNYHDLGRDDWMSLDEYLLSGLSDKDLGKAEGGMIGYKHGGEHRIVPKHRQKKEITIEQIIKDAEASKGPGEQGMISKSIYKLAGDPVIDPLYKAKEKIKDILRTGRDKVKNIGSGLLSLIGTKEAGATPSGMHPLVEFKEMHDQYILDGGELSFKEFFDIIQIELDKMAGE